jgi:hypothetical protein
MRSRGARAGKPRNRLRSYKVQPWSVGLQPPRWLPPLAYRRLALRSTPPCSSRDAGGSTRTSSPSTFCCSSRSSRPTRMALVRRFPFFLWRRADLSRREYDERTAVCPAVERLLWPPRLQGPRPVQRDPVHWVSSAEF